MAAKGGKGGVDGGVMGNGWGGFGIGEAACGWPWKGEGKGWDGMGPLGGKSYEAAKGAAGAEALPWGKGWGDGADDRDLREHDKGGWVDAVGNQSSIDEWIPGWGGGKGWEYKGMPPWAVWPYGWEPSEPWANTKGWV